jgi:hypothetical protein
VTRHVFLLLSFAACLALAGVPAFAEQIGVAAAVNQQAEGMAPGATVRTLSIGDRLVHNERIDTDGAGLLQVLLADGTTFTVGPNSRLTIDSFVYDPNRGTAKITASLGKGVFRFIGGRSCLAGWFSSFTQAGRRRGSIRTATRSISARMENLIFAERRRIG